LFLVVVLLAVVLLCLDHGDASRRSLKHRSRFGKVSRKFQSRKSRRTSRPSRRRFKKSSRKSSRKHSRTSRKSKSTHHVSKRSPEITNLELKMKSVEVKLNTLSSQPCPNGKEGEPGQCTLCQQEGQPEDTILKFEIPDEMFDGSGAGRIACCWEGDTVDGTGKCVGGNPPCDQISAATYDGGENILYLRNIEGLPVMGSLDMYGLSCDQLGCCSEVSEAGNLARVGDINIDCDLFLEVVEVDSTSADCGGRGYRVKVVGGLDANLASTAGLNFDIFNNESED